MSRYASAERVALESQRVERVYATMARGYDAVFDWALGPGRRRAIESLRIQEGDRVLEVGVGTGLSLPLYPEYCHVTGVDISAAMLDRARRRLEALDRRNVVLRRMDARSLSFGDGEFDFVVAPYVISVVPEPQRVMSEMVRVCRPGGTLLVVNHFGSRIRAVAGVERLLTPASQWIGFRLDLPLDLVVATPGLEVRSMERVNLLGLWRLVELQKRP